MIPQNERSPLPPTTPTEPAAGRGGCRKATVILTSDRLYQLAALTAGAFLLATLL